jgi:hypothetical protein
MFVVKDLGRIGLTAAFRKASVQMKKMQAMHSICIECIAIFDTARLNNMKISVLGLQNKLNDHS